MWALQQWLREETIILGLEENSYEEALQEMVRYIPDWCLDWEGKQDAFSALIRREGVSTTAVGGGVAFPHCMTDVRMPIALLAVSQDGIAFPSLDGQLVHLIYMLVVPENEETPDVLRSSLHEMGMLFRDNFLKQRLKLSRCPEEAYEVLLRESNAFKEQLRIA